MNYSELTDIEINDLVAELVDHAVFYNYCNNANDAWPIILENKIHTGWAYDDYWSAEISNQGQAGPFKRWNHTDENPLRAAMIVFLMMNEGE